MLLNKFAQSKVFIVIQTFPLPDFFCRHHYSSSKISFFYQNQKYSGRILEFLCLRSIKSYVQFPFFSFFYRQVLRVKLFFVSTSAQILRDLLLTGYVFSLKSKVAQFLEIHRKYCALIVAESHKISDHIKRICTGVHKMKNRRCQQESKIFVIGKNFNITLIIHFLCKFSRNWRKNW